MSQNLIIYDADFSDNAIDFTEDISLRKITSITIVANETIVDSAVLAVSILPSNATYKKVEWSIVNGNEYATISSTGLLTVVQDGSIIVRADAKDGSGVYSLKAIDVRKTNSDNIIKVTSISIYGDDSITDSGTYSATALPANATNKTITWSIVKGTSYADINQSGEVTVKNNGSVTIRATANDGSGVSADKEIYVNKTEAQVTTETIVRTNYSPNKSAFSDVLPICINDGYTIEAEIDVSNVGDSSAVGDSAFNLFSIGQNINNWTTSSKQIMGYYYLNNINLSFDLNNGSSNVKSTNITPSNGKYHIVLNMNGFYVNNTKLFTASQLSNILSLSSLSIGACQGTYSTATYNYIKYYKDSSTEVTDTKITSITINGDSTITSQTAQYSATISPSNATNKSISWDISNGSAYASIDSNGKLTVIGNGSVTIKATANDGSGVSATKNVTINVPSNTGTTDYTYTTVDFITNTGLTSDACAYIDNLYTIMSASTLVEIKTAIKMSELVDTEEDFFQMYLTTDNSHRGTIGFYNKTLYTNAKTSTTSQLQNTNIGEGYNMNINVKWVQDKSATNTDNVTTTGYSYVDGTVETTTWDNALSFNGANVCLFASHNPSNHHPMYRGKMYSFKLYDNNILKRDLVPKLRSDGAYGLWDNVTSTFYTSSTSVPLSGGNDN